MDMKTLSEQLSIDVNALLIKITHLNNEHKLDIDDVDNLTVEQYDIIRASLDTTYLVKLIRKGDKSDRKYNYQKTPDYRDLVHWLSQHDLNGVSTSAIKQSLPDNIVHRGHQTIAAAMRSLGYTSNVTYLGHGSQGRRWSKEVASPDTPSFL